MGNKDEKIDIVIIWVDGNDEKWQKEKEKYEKEILNKEDIDISQKRYRTWDNLQYVFRSIEKFIPWYNNIYFITCGQTPKWLNTSNPRLKCIDHKDYIPEKYLPTFNCNPIELNFHRIKGLSEEFIYFNDDMFILKEMKKEEFFKDGLPCETAVLNPIKPEDVVFNQILFNNTSLINRNFDKKVTLKNYRSKFINLKYGKDLLRTFMCLGSSRFLGFKYSHLPTSLLKSTYIEVWEKEYNELDKACCNKFRSKNDYSQYLMKDWQIAEGKFYPRSYKTGKYMRVDDSNIKEIQSIIENKKCKMLCVNDTDDISDFENTKKLINSSLDKILPDKCSFEK